MATCGNGCTRVLNVVRFAYAFWACTALALGNEHNAGSGAVPCADAKPVVIANKTNGKVPSCQMAKAFSLCKHDPAMAMVLCPVTCACVTRCHKLYYYKGSMRFYHDL